MHYYIEKLFWKLEDNLEEIEAIFVETSQAIPKMIIVSESTKLKSKIDSSVKKFEKKLECSFVPKNQLKKLSSEFLFPLHDPNNIIEKLKGGEVKEDG